MAFFLPFPSRAKLFLARKYLAPLELVQVMDNIELFRMSAVEREHWWYQALDRFLLDQWVSPVKPPRVLDLGCGSGRLFRLFQSSPDSIGVDVSDALAERFPTTHGAFQKADLWQFVQKLSESEKFDLILSIDSIYFLPTEQQKALLAKLSLHLNEDGAILLHLPAGALFARHHDRKVGIRSRYSKNTVHGLLPSGLRLLSIRYRMFLLSPIVFLVALLDRFRLRDQNATDLEIPRLFVNKILYRIVRWDDGLFSLAPFGSSLFVKLGKEKTKIS
jgi:SAM-dependent methyltransferase